MPQVPVLSINMGGLEKNPGFHFTVSMVMKSFMGLIFGDILLRVLYAVRPYEKEPGSADKLAHYWSLRIAKEIGHMSVRKYRRYTRELIRDFDELPIRSVIKPRVGVVGEILVKYHPNANNDIVGIIESEGGEAVVPDLADFLLYGMYSKEYNFKYLSGSYKTMLLNKAGIAFIEWLRKPMRKALAESRHFHPPLHIDELAEKASRITSIGNQCGEGWLLTGEMVELIDSGVENIVCLQPFACLPNHVTGKGMLKALRKYEPQANIAPIDYDPVASDVNQMNRIKLMMATAHRNLELKTHNIQRRAPKAEDVRNQATS
jgi:predicted nucleotide-binding protein (sugar kinase/HSP70/actin superfamily)